MRLDATPWGRRLPFLLDHRVPPLLRFYVVRRRDGPALLSGEPGPPRSAQDSQTWPKWAYGTRQNSQSVRPPGRTLIPRIVTEGSTVTMPDERSRALLWAGGFLIELARDEKLPLAVRRRAVVIARHFPTIEQVATMALFRHSSGLGMGLAAPNETSSWAEGCKFGPLRYSTRLDWPED